MGQFNKTSFYTLICVFYHNGFIKIKIYFLGTIIILVVNSWFHPLSRVTKSKLFPLSKVEIKCSESVILNPFGYKNWGINISVGSTIAGL